jgi:radical SAM superfamily enzyme YgiQ (UPF0313 family)
MAEIVLTTLNAKYIHASLGLRYLFANLGDLKSRSLLREFDINQRPVDVAESLLAEAPRVIGFGVYIWNVSRTTEVLSIIKRVSPETIVVVGGPEVSYELEGQAIVSLADYVITGEGDLAFAQFCRELLSGLVRVEKVIPGGFPEFSQLALPYEFYDEADVRNRIIYVEASRGCPFHCEFCLSSLDIPLRQAPLPSLLEHLERLLERGVTQFKFVDRTFNVNIKAGLGILEFLLRRFRPGLFFHFEMIPDRLPEALRGIIIRFPPGALQFEAGIQTFNEEVSKRISRHQDYARTEENLRWLRTQTGVHLHTDLIFGLPGEPLESFAAGFDRLVGIGPQEIQVGILKRLRGTPISRHDREWDMVYSPHAPYEILRNKLIDFPTVQSLRRFARYWDMVGNSGNFIQTTPLLWSSSRARESISPFDGFMQFSVWLHAKLGRTDSVALVRLTQLVFEYLTQAKQLQTASVAATLLRDYQRGGRRDVPEFLRGFVGSQPLPSPGLPGQFSTIPRRQARHLR